MAEDKESSDKQEAKPETQDSEQKQKVTKLILEQIKQLLELNSKLNEKVRDIEVKVSKGGGISESSPEIEKRLSNVERNMEKLLGLYELVTNQYNPFIEKQPMRNFAMPDKKEEAPPAGNKINIQMPMESTKIAEEKPVANMLKAEIKPGTKTEPELKQPAYTENTGPEISSSPETKEEIKRMIQQIKPAAININKDEHSFPLKEKVTTEYHDIPGFEPNHTHLVIDCSKLNDDDEEETEEEKLNEGKLDEGFQKQNDGDLPNEDPKEQEKNTEEDNPALKRFKETVNGEGLLNLEKEFYSKIDNFMEKEDNDEQKKKIITTLVSDFEHKLISDLMDKVHKKTVVMGLIDPKYYFYLSNGACVRNLRELSQALKNADIGTFRHHVNNGKNDFSNWIRDVLQNEKLSESIKSIYDKEEMVKQIDEFI